jgi:Protein of unknown function (DUF1552)
MNFPHVAFKRSLDRRSFLKSSGAALTLPLLEAMAPAFAKETAQASLQPKRMLCIMTNMGVLPRNFFPKKAGRDYELSPYLQILKAHKKDMTVFSGVCHPDVAGNHSSEHSFLSCAPGPGASSFKNSISVDQLAAEQLGDRTRFGSMPLLVGKPHDGFISQTRDGVALPTEARPSAVYRKLFLQGEPDEIEDRVKELKKGCSILDFVRDDAKALEKSLGPRDRARMDQYFTSVRELEQRLVHNQEWERKPKTKTKVPEPVDVVQPSEVEAQTDQMYDMVKLALETDSTRIISVYLGPLVVVANIPGVEAETHSLTHHGNDEAKIEQLIKIERVQFQCLDRLLTSLKTAKEGSGSLLDNTITLYGSNLSNANAHDTHNLPVLLAGGGFKHGQHLAFDQQHNTPVANIFVSMLQQFGVETDKFASSTGTLTGLEKA